MTEKQRKVYEVIKIYIKENKISPTVREICYITGNKSTSTIHGVLNRLKVKGYINSIQGSPRSISIINEVDDDLINTNDI